MSKRQITEERTLEQKNDALVEIIARNLPRLDIIGIYTDDIRKKVEELLEELTPTNPATAIHYHCKVINVLLDNLESMVQASLDEVTGTAKKGGK